MQVTTDLEVSSKKGTKKVKLNFVYPIAVIALVAIITYNGMTGKLDSYDKDVVILVLSCLCIAQASFMLKPEKKVKAEPTDAPEKPQKPAKPKQEDEYMVVIGR